MGFTPRQVDEMTIAEFVACARGFSKAHGGKDVRPAADVDDADLRMMGIEGF
jgi:hypothetical protein